MHRLAALQQSAPLVHRPFSLEQPDGGAHFPLLHAPPQQSKPLAHAEPSALQRASAEVTRKLPLPSSCPGM